MSDPNPIDGATARALDRYSVPPLSSGFADRLVAKALAGESIAPLPPVTEPRRERRGVWARGRKVVIGVAAFSLMSAAAAATGVFGDAAKNVPVIGPLIAIVAPAPKPKAIVTPKPKPAAPAPKLVAPPVVADEPPLDVAQPTQGEIMSPRVRRQIKREFVAQRFVDQIERYEMLGIKPPPEQRAKFAERLENMPPAQRLALVKRIREIRRERLAANQPIGSGAPKADIPLLDAETRRQLREDRLRLREERRLRQMQREEAEAAPVPDEATPPLQN
jgi:hypothetical protein